MIGTQLSIRSKGILITFGSLLFIAVGVIAAGLSFWASFLLIAGVLVFVGALLDPAMIFTAVYPFLIIFGQIPIRIFETDISLERILVLLGGLGIVGGVLVTRRLRIAPINSSILFGLILWFGFYIVSTLVFQPKEGSTILLSYLMKIILGYVVFLSLNHSSQYTMSLKSFLLASFLASLVTIFLYVQEGSLSFIRESTYVVGETIEESIIRGTARAGAGNTMALWIAFLFLWKAQGWKQKILWIILVFWFGAVSLFALRREALITIPILLVILIFYKPIGKRRQAVLISLLLIMVLSIVVVISPEWQERLLGETVEDLSSGIDTRLVLLTTFTPAVFRISPWLGFGPGNYAITQFRFPNLMTPYILQSGGVAAHNSWSAAIVEAGIMAFIGLCLIQAGIGKPLLNTSYDLKDDLKILWAFAPLIFIQLLFSMFFGHALQLPVTWFWMGLLAALPRLVQKYTN